MKKEKKFIGNVEASAIPTTLGELFEEPIEELGKDEFLKLIFEELGWDWSVELLHQCGC